MSAMQRLTTTDRRFFSLVSQAVMANVFSDERKKIDLEIAGPGPHDSRESLFDAVIARVNQRFGRLEKTGPVHLGRFGEKDRALMKNTILFFVFHRYTDLLDELIDRQVKAGDKPLAVPFGTRAIDELRARGFGEEESIRLFALCYQFRRAYFFIYRSLVGRSRCMQQFKEKLWNNVFTHNVNLYQEHLWDRMEDFSTLVLGTTGTGKGTAAMAIGRSGFIPFDPAKNCFVESFMRSFVSLNLSQFPEALIESELFGHRKGAFTGAVDTHDGVFDRCSRYGAIFLDEIGDVSIPVQIKLLKVLEERQYSPVGSHTTRRFDGRVIAATNRPLSDLRPNGSMRDDFFYRLCSDLMVVPPLAQRIREDEREFDDLVSHTVTRIVGRPSADLDKMVKKVIRRDLGPDYGWPGNVRELGQCIRSILLNRSCRSLAPGADGQSPTGLEADLRHGRLDAQQLLQKYCHTLYRRYGTYGEVARCTRLDRRTVKKYVVSWEGQE